MRTILKYQITPPTEPGPIDVATPFSFEPLHIAADEMTGTISVWALVQVWDDPNVPVPTRGRRFWMFGTGWPIPDDDDMGDLDYVGTVQFVTITPTPLVFHVFQEQD